MSYFITHDHITDGGEPGTNLNAVGVREGTFSPALFSGANPSAITFRLFDGDDELYYEGIASDEDSVLEALDWAAANAGCTHAEVYNGMTWEVL